MIVAAPFEGSPLATEMVAHLGRTGRLPNLAFAMDAVPMGSSANAGVSAIPMTKNSRNVQATTRIMRPPELSCAREYSRKPIPTSWFSAPAFMART